STGSPRPPRRRGPGRLETRTRSSWPARRTRSPRGGGPTGWRRSAPGWRAPPRLPPHRASSRSRPAGWPTRRTRSRPACARGPPDRSRSRSAPPARPIAWPPRSARARARRRARRSQPRTTAPSPRGNGCPSSPSGPWQDGVVVREHDGEEEAVQPVQNATVSRDNPAGVLGTEGALEGRLAEVAELRQHADRGAQHERLAAPQAGEEDQAAERRDHHRAGERAERALDRLARTDRGRELVAAESAAGQIAARVRAHRHEDREQHPTTAEVVVGLAKQHEVGREEAHVEHAQEGEPETMHGAR